jgi:predicted MFS family arabinose efflux permease
MRSLLSEEADNRRLLAVFIFVRLVVSTAFRMVFPFLPAMARGLGVPIESVAAAVSARSGLGMLGPALGAIADMRGRKQALLAGLILFSISLIVMGIWPSYAVFFICLVLTGGATVVIDSSVHAYIGDRIPYAQRGRATATVELGWSLAFVVSIPIIGWSMVRFGWSSPFIWLGLTSLLAGGLVGLVVPRTLPISGSWGELKGGIRRIFSAAPLVGLLVAMLMTTANQVISIVFGIWMEDSFGLMVDQLGLASIVIGLGGLVGVGCAVLFTDKLGKRLAIGLGLALNSAICLVFLVIGDQLWGALTALFFFFLTFEFSVTSLLPLMTTLSVQARGVFMAATLAAFSLGDAFGALIGPIFIRTGLGTNVAGTVVINLCGLFLLLAFIKPLTIDQPAVEPL